MENIQSHDIAARVAQAKDNPYVINDIIEDYLPFIASIASKACKRKVEYGVDDEINIAMLGFHDAAASYSPLRGAFLKYASVVMTNRIIDYQRKENRHSGISSIDEIDEDSGLGLGDSLSDGEDEYENRGYRAATRQEIAELSAELATLGVTLADLSECKPKQQRTLEACSRVAVFAAENKELTEQMKRSGNLPVTQLKEATGMTKRMIERHRKYIIALMVIYSNGYEIIRGHLKQVLIVARQRRSV